VAAKFGLVGEPFAGRPGYASANRGSGGVTVNCICPVGPGRRSSAADRRAPALGSAAIRDFATRKQPSLRVLPDGSRAWWVWLCEPAAPDLTGVTSVDGG
jgi:hypothetical protein